MPTPEGSWAEYSIGTLIDDSVAQTATVERVHRTELNAWRSAGPRGNRVVFLRFGETIEEAVEREQAEPIKSAERAPRTRKPAAERIERAEKLLRGEVTDTKAGA